MSLISVALLILSTAFVLTYSEHPSCLTDGRPEVKDHRCLWRSLHFPPNGTTSNVIIASDTPALPQAWVAGISLLQTNVAGMRSQNLSVLPAVSHSVHPLQDASPKERQFPWSKSVWMQLLREAVEPVKRNIDRRVVCSGSCLVTTQPIVFAIFILMAFLFLSQFVSMPWTKFASSENVTASSLGCFYLFVLDVLFASTIPHAFSVATQIGMNAVYSGVLIAAQSPGRCIGSCISWYLIKRNPSLWRTAGRTQILFAILLQIFGTFAFCTQCYVAALGIRSPSLPLTLVLSRFVVGIGDGLLSHLCRFLFGTLLPASERPAQMGRAVVATTLGIGLGPAFASGAQALASFVPCGQAVPGFVSASTAALAFPVVSLLSFWMYPSLENISSFEPSQEVHVSSSAAVDDSSTNAIPLRTTYKRRWVIITALIFTSNRAYCVSALEAATALILELEYKFRHVPVGLLISICFCCTPIFKLFLDAMAKYLSLPERLRMLMVLVILGGLLMLITGYFSLLLIADVLLFPAFFLGDGLVQGIMQQHTFPAGHFLDLNTSQLFLLVAMNGFARGVGPPLARWHVQNGGQWQYAVQQLVCGIAGWVLLEWLLLNRLPLEAMLEADDDGEISTSK